MFCREDDFYNPMSVASIKATKEEQMQNGETIEEFEDRVLNKQARHLNKLLQVKYKENMNMQFSLNLALRMLLRSPSPMFNTRSSNSLIVSPSCICSSLPAFILETDIGLKKNPSLGYCLCIGSLDQINQYFCFVLQGGRLLQSYVCCKYKGRRRGADARR